MPKFFIFDRFNCLFLFHHEKILIIIFTSKGSEKKEDKFVINFEINIVPYYSKATKIYFCRMKSKTLLIFMIFFQQISCYGQEISFLNKFHFPITDTVAHKPHYYQEVFSHSDSVITKVYTLDKILVKEEIHFLDNDKKEEYRTIVEYDSIGNVEARRKNDRKANSEYSVLFYPNGQLRSRHHYVNHEAVLEEYFDENGKPVKKPDEVYPSPNGGMKGWNKYLAKNLSYPKEARRKRQKE